MKPSSLVLEPIGTISTPHRSKYSAPRQPATAAEKSIGVITLAAGSNFEQALEDLRGFDYVWLIFWFHKNTNWKPKVLPPHGGRIKRGVFATRSPHRPNPIGLSLCRLIAVRGRTLRVENPDMLDGTPILDIKPYLPHAESFPNARGGWIGESHELTPASFEVSFQQPVVDALTSMKPAERLDVRTYLEGLLRHDPFPHAYRRIIRQDDGTYVIAVRRWRFSYEVRDRRVTILRVTQDRRISEVTEAETQDPTRKLKTRARGTARK